MDERGGGASSSPSVRLLPGHQGADTSTEVKMREERRLIADGGVYAQAGRHIL